MEWTADADNNSVSAAGQNSKYLVGLMLRISGLSDQIFEKGASTNKAINEPLARF